MDNSTQHQAANPLVAVSDGLAAIVDQVGRSAVGVAGRGGRGVASGVVWKASVLVTAAHVFRRVPQTLNAVGADGVAVQAELAGVDAGTDIAVFRLPDEALPAAQIGDASVVKAGHLVVAVGRSGSGDLTASHGLVNRAGAAWQTWLGGAVDRLIRLDGGVHEGLSGAPVANMRGSVVGIATSALSRAYGIVLPASTVSRVVDALLTSGHVARGYLGIGAQPVRVPRSVSTDPVGAAGAEPRSGLLITALSPGGPAEQAGLWVGDIVVDIAGRPAGNLHELRSSLAGRVGERVRVGLVRGGAETDAAVTVGQWPARERAC